MNLKRFFVLVSLVASLLLVACTTEREPVDKSPELSLAKSLFDGEFFYRQTVVELPYTADYSFIGESNDGKILKWKITKNWLIAYDVHDNLEVVNTAEEPVINETPVLAYRILMHYDILPQENPTTGEDLPMYVVNTDCRWNECHFFQIDQSYNGTPNFELKYMALSEQLWGAPYYRGAVTSATDFEFYAHDGTYIPPKLYYYFQKKAKTEQDKKEKEVEWFTFRTQEQLIPFNWGSFYTWSDIEEFFKTEPANIWYRHTFIKVNRDVYGRRTYDLKTKTWPWKKGKIDNGFRPMVFNDEQFRMFGYFVNKFKGYNPDHGYRDDSYYTLANYFNIAWGRLKKNAVEKKDGVVSGADIDWNFVCDYTNIKPTQAEKDAGGWYVVSPSMYNECLKQIYAQQKIPFTYSAETPKRIIPADCAMAKDYNHTFLAARFAAMNPGSDTRDFDAWYAATYKDDFFKTYVVNGKKITVRDEGWYTHPQDYDNWEDKCFVVSDKEVRVQNWFGDVSKDNHINEVATLIHNPVEGYIEYRDGNHLAHFGNYDNFSSASTDGEEEDVNSLRICVPKEDAENADDYTKLRYYENCLKNDTYMSSMYKDEYDREWRGDSWDCRILTGDETCDSVASNEAIGEQKDIKEWVEVRAACVLNSERTCKTYGEDVVRPILRHKYMNGDMTVAMWNWVDQPTEYGILGVSQWVINPETGQSLGAGSNIAGSVLQWAVNRAVEMSRMIVSSDDPAAWDWEDLTHPEYAQLPKKIWDNDPDDARNGYTPETRSVVVRKDAVDAKLHEGASLQQLYKMPLNQHRFDFASVKGTKWEGKMLPYSLLKAMFPWSDPSQYNYSDKMKEQLTHIFIPEQTELEMERVIQRGKNTYFEASFLDGAIIQFLQERQKEYQDKYGDDWNGSKKEAYTKDFLSAVSHDLEILMYKGVAEHEMGHSLGLRHNFISSADMWNYKDDYFAPENYPNLLKQEKELVKKLTDEGVDPGVIGDRVYALKRAYPFSPVRNSKGGYDRLPGTDEDVIPISYNMYVSVMDYQSEPYIHAVGLGKYDMAAFKFVYGRSVEQMDVDKDGFVKMSTDNPVRDVNFPLPVLKNVPYIDTKSGELKKVTDVDKFPRKLVRYYDENNKLVWRLVMDAKTDDLGQPIVDSSTGTYVPANSEKYLINDGSIYPYLFFSDEKRMDEPANNVWDTGYLASDIIRSFRYMDDKYYYLRYFRRGNPRFREFRGRRSMKMVYDTLLRKYKYVHFLLDLNYNMFRSGWLGSIPRDDNSACTPQTLVLSPDKDTKVTNKFCEDYRRAVHGKEYWLDDQGNFRELTPMEAGDYLAAGALGVNYLLDDVIYRPDSGNDYLKIGRTGQISENPYLIVDKIEPYQTGYWKVSNYVGLSQDMLLQVPATIGRYQKDHWDIQDDPTVYYDKVTRRGYAEEKMVALYTLSNSGWFSSKYRRESMANSIGDGNALGLEHVKFRVLAEVANEDALLGLSPYCVHNGKVEKVALPIQTVLNYLGGAPFYGGYQIDLPSNMCAYYGMMTATGLEKEDIHAPVEDRQDVIWSNLKKQMDNAAKYEPIMAGWTYYDKTWPLYWGMGNVANISADTTILWKFVTMTYTTAEKSLYPEPDVDEIEVLNSMGNRYYRAKLPVNDMLAEDRAALTRWKAKKAAGASDEEALCVPADPTDTSATASCLHYCSDPVTDGEGIVQLDKYGFVQYKTSTTCSGDIVPPAGLQTLLNRYKFMKQAGYKVPVEVSAMVPDRDTFAYYLRSTYSRFSPAFRLAWSLERYNTNPQGEVKSDPADQPVTIMETTLDSMNAWAKSNLDMTVMYAWY